MTLPLQPRTHYTIPAFTLIEVLVVVAIIGIVAGLTIPAVQWARESARRAQCIANLKQIGIGLHNYESLNNTFPPSQLTNGAGVQVSQLAELLFLLPKLEQQPLYSSLNMSIATGETAETPTLENHTARNTRLTLFLCPSDSEPNHLNSYRFNRGRFGVKPGIPFDGPFSIGILPRTSVVTDGLSRTAFVSERIGGSYNPNATNRPRDIKYPQSLSTPIFSDDVFIPLCLSSAPQMWQHLAGRYWMFSGFTTAHYNHNGTPNDTRPTCSTGILRDWGPGGLSPPRSYHSGSVNVLLGDGHVEVAVDSIERSVWTALGTFNAND